MSAVLMVKASPKSYTFRAERITASDGGREVALVFPSPAACGLKPNPDGTDLALTVSARGDSWVGDKTYSQSLSRVLYRKGKEKVDPGFTVVVPAGAIIAGSGHEGSVQVQLTLASGCSLHQR